MSAFESFSRITPFLWFDSNAEEAVDFYLAIFKNSRRLDEVRNEGEGPGPKGSVITIAFELDGQQFTALNGGPAFKFTEAISMTVRCDNQQEVDYYWEKLSAGGKEIECGWLKDKFGLAWQIVPKQLPELIKTAKGMKAMMTMQNSTLRSWNAWRESKLHFLNCQNTFRNSSRADTLRYRMRRPARVEI